MVGADTLVRIVSSKASIIEIVGHDVDENNIDTIEAFIRELQITIIIPLFRGYVASLKMLFSISRSSVPTIFAEPQGSVFSVIASLFAAFIVLINYCNSFSVLIVFIFVILNWLKIELRHEMNRIAIFRLNVQHIRYRTS